MSLRPIPNQPINLLPTEIITSCPDKDVPTLIAEGDTVLLQFQQERCEGAEQWIVSPTFKGGDWNTNETVGWTVQTGAGGVCAVVDNGGSILQNTNWTPNAGQLYELRIVVNSVQGSGFFVNVAGLIFSLTGVGEYVFTFIAQNTDQLQLQLADDTSAGCIGSVFVYDANTSFELAIVQDGADIAVVDPVNQPYLFTYSGRNVVVEWPLPEAVSGCFGFVLRDACTYGDPVDWCSQPFRVADCKSTVKLRVCNDAEALGFVAGRFEVRVQASLIRPTWEYEVAEERLSNGRINRHFIDRQSVYQFLIEIQNEKLHPFLAAMSMFDHFYIEDGAWSIDAEAYAPGYDSLTGSGGVALNVRKVQELVRKVLCDDAGPGCDPADDPICSTADVTIATVWVEGELFIRVDVLSSLGFEVSQINWSIDEVAQTPVSVGGVAGPYALGPVLSGQLIQITFVNAQDPLCNDVREVLEVPSSCEVIDFPEGCQHFTFDYQGITSLLLATDTNDPQTGVFYTVIAPDGQDYQVASGDQISFDGEGNEGTYCMYSSDEDGNPIAGTWNELTIQGVDTEEVPYPISNLDLSQVFISGDGETRLEHYGVQFAVDPDYSHMTGLLLLSFLQCSFQSRPDTSGMTWLETIVMQVCIASLGPVLIGMTALKNVTVDYNALSTSEVNRMLVEVSTYSTVTDGTFGAQQTPAAPPSGAGLTAKAELEGRSPGWTITVDP
jgi:hypothetical protein